MTGSDDTSARVRRMPEVGEVVDERYRLEEIIATGGMGVIMRARQLAMERDVAVKLLHPHMTADPETVARFEREVHLAKLLTHPNTIQLFDFGTTDGGSLYIVMEYLQGEDLRSLVRREAPLAAGRAIEIALQSLDGLAAAHEKNVIHRDIKPSNIFISRHRRGGDLVKVLDFGVAKSLESSQQDLTATGKICGTPRYMAPEAVLQDQSGKTGDVYAMGLILLEMLIGRQVFNGQGLAQLILMQLQKPVPIPERLADTSLAQVIRRACAKHPGQRYPDADAMLDALEQATDSVPADLKLESNEVPELPDPSSDDILRHLGGKTPPGLQVLEDHSSVVSHQTVPDNRGNEDSTAPHQQPERTLQDASSPQPTYPPGEQATPGARDRSDAYRTPSRPAVDRSAPHEKTVLSSQFHPTERTDAVDVSQTEQLEPVSHKETERTESPFPLDDGQAAANPGDKGRDQVSSGFQATPDAEQSQQGWNDRDRSGHIDRRLLWAGGLAAAALLGVAVWLAWDLSTAEPVEILADQPAQTTEALGSANGAVEPRRLRQAIGLSASIVQKSAEMAGRRARRRAQKAPAESESKPIEVRLVSTPAGASVSREGRRVGETPFMLRMPPDRRVRLRLEKAGFESREVALKGPPDGPAYAFDLQRVEAANSGSDDSRSGRPSESTGGRPGGQARRADGAGPGTEAPSDSGSSTGSAQQADQAAQADQADQPKENDEPPTPANPEPAPKDDRSPAAASKDDSDAPSDESVEDILNSHDIDTLDESE